MLHVVGMASPKNDPKQDDDGADDVEDLVSAINYNTITSMAALKEILGNDSSTSSEDVSWFQHYFLRHVNRLPSRSQYLGRRLSECKEEDEGQDVDVKSESLVQEIKPTELIPATK
jgi:5'-AMP-activated protein kinase regulatory gamma subunit